jgi:O-acetyl-ADP-ribose deacetylase (regulator of RNase III)
MMIEFTEGNLLDSNAEALVNTVNTVGVMGKGIALMFKDSFQENFEEYQAACSAKKVQVGKMFVTRRESLLGPKWIINFPTKQHWRYPSKMEWIESGLDDLISVIVSNGIRSVALPPLGAGNGGLEWTDVREVIVNKLKDLDGVRVIVFEPTRKYMNVAKRTGVERLSAPRALVAELIRRYSILGIECSLLEVQKLGYFAERFNRKLALPEFEFDFAANRFGPYSEKLKHMLDDLDGSYLHCDKRLADAGPFEPIRFDEAKRDQVALFMKTEGREYLPTVEATAALIDGFESPLSMELLATVDWLVVKMNAEPTAPGIREQLRLWPGGQESAERKLHLFEDRSIDIALDALKDSTLIH